MTRKQRALLRRFHIVLYFCFGLSFIVAMATGFCVMSLMNWLDISPFSLGPILTGLGMLLIARFIAKPKTLEILHALCTWYRTRNVKNFLLTIVVFGVFLGVSVTLSAGIIIIPLAIMGVSTLASLTGNNKDTFIRRPWIVTIDNDGLSVSDMPSWMK